MNIPRGNKCHYEVFCLIDYPVDIDITVPCVVSLPCNQAALLFLFPFLIGF